MKTEIREWRPARGTNKWNRDCWTPAYPGVAFGAHTLVVNADDVGRFTSAAECAGECLRRNAAQIERAKAEVARLERELATAREHLTEVTYALQPRS